MIIVFASNWFNHHEKFFCDAINSIPDVEFYFIQTESIPDERLKLGYQDITKSTPYCICSYDSQADHDRALDICNNADALILGSAPYEFIVERVRNNKLTFFYAERLFRKGLWHMLYPPTFFTVLKRFIIPGRKSNFYLLAASGYTAWDTSRIFAFDNRRFKWGHFIEVAKQPSTAIKEKLVAAEIRHRKVISLLWAGRLIECKHPDMAVRIAKSLKDKGIPFSMTIIGNGILEKSLKSLINEYSLSDSVFMPGSMTPTEVREYMEHSDIYMFTSDFEEGWGAVLGESMASGCAVVTSHGIGATPFLALNEYNALIYETGNFTSFENKVLRLVKNPDLRKKVANNALNTMRNLWNAEVGANRFYHLCKNIIEKGKPIFYDEGPISKAEIIKNNWFRDDTI